MKMFSIPPGTCHVLRGYLGLVAAALDGAGRSQLFHSLYFQHLFAWRTTGTQEIGVVWINE